MKTAFLFPGQGAQYPGMGKDLWESSQAVKDLLKLASDTTEMDLPKIIFEGTEDELKQTDKQQVAITVVSLAASTFLNEKGIHADAAAGFSLGEFSALCEAGVLGVEDTLRTVKARGEIFARVSQSLSSASGGPGMAAVVGLAYEKVKEALEGVNGVYIANYNSPTQIAVSGTADGLDAAEPVLKEAGARRYIRLKVSGPFHSPLLEQARSDLADFLGGIRFSDPKIAVYSNVTGKRTSSGAEAKDLVIRQVISTVRWVDEERSLVEDGAERFLEVGPGKVLTGLMKSFDSEQSCLTAGTAEDIAALEG